MIVLDTHVWVWWVGNPELLSTPAQRTIDEAIESRSLFISSISAWEIELLVRKGRLRLTMDSEAWLAKSESLPFLRFVPVDNRIAVRSVQLAPPLHDDPADRIIIATAQMLGAKLVTKDRRIRDYDAIKTVW